MKRFVLSVAVSSALVAVVFAVSGCSEAAEADETYAAQLDLPSLDSVPLARTDLSVEAAYQRIPHRRTEFDFTRSKIGATEGKYLGLAFRVIEEATRIRVSLLDSLSSQDGSRRIAEQNLRRGAEIHRFWVEITPPEPLVSYHDSISVALEQQLLFFRGWIEAGSAYPYQGRGLSRAPQVRASSQALHHAYDRLMRRYPGESAHNRDAFFDYHCALDFL